MALDFSKFGTPVEQTPVLDFSKFGTPAQPPEKQSAFRQIADVPLGIAKGAVQGVRMIADAFGAGSDTSKTIKSAETYLADLMSAQAKNDQQEIARIMKDAEDKGVLDQVKAGIKAFTVAPIDTLSSALGTAAPVIAGALGAKVLGAGALLTTGVSALTGAGMGAGTIKGSIYEETKKTLKEAGASEQDAEARAKLAQEYGGKNLDQILLGTVLGGAAALGPLEKGGAAILARRILGKTGTEATETVAGQAAKGAVRRRLEAGALEAVPEAIQAGQEQVAQNIALQREGFDVPTFRGAAGAMTLEALAGAGLGATVGGGKPAPEVPPAAPPVAPPPAAPEAEAPEPEKLMITRVMDMAAQTNGYGLLEQQKQRLLAEPQSEDIKKELTFIQEIQDRMNIETAQRLTPSGKSPFEITPEFLTELGIKPTAAVARRIKGKSLDDPAVATELETYANKYASEEAKPKILKFVQTLKPPVEPAAAAPVPPPVAPAPPAPFVAPGGFVSSLIYEGAEPLSVEDADFELEALQNSAEKGRLAPEQFAVSEIGKRLDTGQMIAINEGLRADPIGTITALRDRLKQATAAPAAVEKAAAPAATAAAPAPAAPKFEPQIVSRQPAPDGMEVHVFTTTDGYGTGLFDADANQYVNGSVTRFSGEDTLPKAEARAAEMLQKATPIESVATKAETPSNISVPASEVEETTTPAEEARDIQEPTIRNKLKTIAQNLGVLVFETGEKYSSSSGVVTIPTEDKQVEGAQSPEHVFAHELGHAILQKRGVSYKGMPKSYLDKWIPGWDKLKAISKAYRPEIHNHKLPKFRRHANKPDEIIADALGSFLLGISSKQDIDPIIKALNLNDYDLGLKGKTKPSVTATAAPTVEAAAPKAEVPAAPAAPKQPAFVYRTGGGDETKMRMFTEDETVEFNNISGRPQLLIRGKNIAGTEDDAVFVYHNNIDRRSNVYDAKDLQKLLDVDPAVVKAIQKWLASDASTITSNGQALAKTLSDFVEGSAAETPAEPKAEAPPTLDTTGITPAKGRHPQVQAAAKLLQEKKMSREEFEKYVDAYRPIETIKAETLYPPSSVESMAKAIRGAENKKKINIPIADGIRVGLRMDLPARDQGVPVVSIHEGKPNDDPKTGKPYKSSGKVIGYGSTGYIKDVFFAPRDQEKSLVMGIEPVKNPLQTAEGTWVNLSPEETYNRVKELMKDPAWKQVGFDPARHGYFYDRKTREPVVSASEMYQVGQFLLAKDVKYAPKENYLYSVEPTVKSDRLPSYKRGVENLRKRWEKGDLTSDEFAARVDILAKQVKMAELAKEKSSRERGADFLRQRLLEAKRRGELSPEAVDFAEWFILQNPALVDDLGISIRTPKEDGVGGMYSSYGRVMYLMKERGSDQTVVHEILHHLERMMPKEVQSAIRKTWIKSLMEAQKNAKTDAEKQFFKNLTDFHFGFGSRSLMKSAIDAIKNGDVSKDLYQYTSPSEFWAENGSEIMRGRFDVKGSVLGRLKQWLSELKEKARSLFGLENKAAIIRALDSLSKGDGKFVSKTLLDEGTEPKLSVTQQGTPGEQAISIVNSLGMGVKPPEPGRAEKAMKMLKDAGENPSLTKESAKKTLTKWLDWFETTVFSSDSAFNNKIRRGIISDFKQNPEVLGMLLEASQSQTVHADALASQFMIDGGLQYNEELKKWESVKKEDNFVALAKKIEELAKKYNVTKDEMERIAHTYFVAKRLPGIIKRNEELDAEIKAERATAKPDRKQIEEWESLKVFVSDEQLAMMEPGLSLVKTIPELKEVVDIWQGIRKNNIDVMVNSGLWSPEYATAMWDNMDYVPYYREEQLEEGAGPQEFIRGLQVKSKEFQLKGSGAAVNDVFDNMIRWSQYAMNRAIRAHKAKQMIDAALKIEVDGKPMATKVTEQKRGMNIVRAFRDGKQELYDMADPMFVPAFSSIQNVSIPTLTFMSKVSNVLRQSVVLYPLFSVAQVPQDSFAAMFSSGLKTQHALKIPYLAVKEFIKTLSKTSATHNELTKYGVVGVRDFSATIIRNDAEIYAGLKPPKGGWGKTKEFMEHIAMAADNAVRQAVYEASMQQGLNKSEALEKAFEIINFRRRGTSKMLNVMGQTVPFFYAYLSAQRVAYRVLSGVGISPTERKEALTTLATTSAAVAALSMLYAMAVGDDEDYAETPAAIRDRTLTIPGSGGVRIPLRPDFFLFPKIIAEHTYLMLSDKGFEDGAKFKKSMADALLSAVASPTPFPTAIKPAIEVAINYDFFQGKPLIGNFEKQKDVERQFRDSTSELAKLFGQTGLISPIAADHMIRGMLGSFGGLLLFGTNQFLHSDPDVPRPELSAKEMLAALPGTSGLLKRPQESALKNDFYVLRDEVEKAANTFNDIKTRSPEGIQAFLEDEKNAIRLGMAKGVDKVNRHLSDIRRRMTIITNMPESQMPADEKAQNIRELRELEREILRSVNVKELREMAKI